MPNEPVKVDTITGIISYFETIDWTDPWLWGLIGFHFLIGFCTCLSILFKRNTVQVLLFCCYLMLVYSTEYINEWAALNYKLFSREQYFDDHGLFISVVFSTPLLFNSIVIVVMWMYEAYQMLIRASKAKMKYHASKNKQAEEKQEGEDRVKDWINKKQE